LSPIYLYNGKILISDGAIAIGRACCCDNDTTCLFPYDITIYIDYDTFTCEDESYATWNMQCYQYNQEIGGIVEFCNPTAPLPTGYWPEYSFINDCNGSLCYPDPLILAGLETTRLIALETPTQEISTHHSPIFTVEIDTDYIDINFPFEDGWIIFYQEEYITKEYRVYQCEFGNVYELCQGSRANIQFYAAKLCDFDGGPTLTNITANVVISSSTNDQNGQAITDTEYVWIDERQNEEVCSDLPPSFLGFTSMVDISCHKECPSIPEE